MGKVFFALLVAVFGLHVSGAMAQVAVPAPSVLTPPGLSPGDRFYIIFAGSNTLNGAQTSATYQNYAAAVKSNDPRTDLVSGWTTLFAHDDGTVRTLSAFSDDTSAPVYNMNFEKLADDRADFFDFTLDTAIGFDEQGNAIASGMWTGFNANGNSAGVTDDTLGGVDTLNDGCLAGISNAATAGWAASTLSGGGGCTGVNFGLYVVSPLMMVPAAPVAVPIFNIPGLLLLVTIVGFMARRYSSRLSS